MKMHLKSMFKNVEVHHHIKKKRPQRRKKKMMIMYVECAKLVTEWSDSGGGYFRW